jgi:hypothetical protein
MSEQWRAVTGYEGLYEVSDQGRVKSIGRYYSPGHPGSKPRWMPERIMRPALTRQTYYTLQLSKDGTSKTFILHRLVLREFVGECPDGMECCHNNGDSTDNRLVNLRWDTPAANIADQFTHRTQRNAFKTHCTNGHEFTPDNTYQLTQNGRPRRMCKACCRDRDRARRAQIRTTSTNGRKSA